MTPFILIRHGPTDWNAEKRLQGHSDIPLTSTSRRWLKTWQIPKDWDGFQWISSPLSRAKETAEILSGAYPNIEPLLIEMNFGDWEGQRLPDLRAALGQEMQDNEDRGLDFTPPNGESPRMVQKRLQPFLQKIASEKEPTIAVAHKGIIRAVMAQAYDWNMLGKPPYKLQQAEAHYFELDTRGNPHIKEMNIPLHPSKSSPE